jgi:hypothetical protein
MGAASAPSRTVVFQAAIVAVLAGGLCRASDGRTWRVAERYELVPEYSRTDNPSGVWSYGWYDQTAIAQARPNSQGAVSVDHANERFRLFTRVRHEVSGLDLWQDAPERLPLLAWVPSELRERHVDDPLLFLQPGRDTAPSVVRWTAPRPGRIRVQARFVGLFDVERRTSEIDGEERLRLVAARWRSGAVLTSSSPPGGGPATPYERRQARIHFNDLMLLDEPLPRDSILQPMSVRPPATLTSNDKESSIVSPAVHSRDNPGTSFPLEPTVLDVERYLTVETGDTLDFVVALGDGTQFLGHLVGVNAIVEYQHEEELPGWRVWAGNNWEAIGGWESASTTPFGPAFFPPGGRGGAGGGAGRSGRADSPSDPPLGNQPPDTPPPGGTPPGGTPPGGGSPPVVTPEPGSLALFGLGACLLASGTWLRRFRSGRPAGRDLGRCG